MRAAGAVLQPLAAAGLEQLAVIVVAPRGGERLGVDVEVHVGLQRQAEPELHRHRAAIDEGEDVARVVGLGPAVRQRTDVLLRLGDAIVERRHRRTTSAVPGASRTCRSRSSPTPPSSLVRNCSAPLTRVREVARLPKLMLVVQPGPARHQRPAARQRHAGGLQVAGDVDRRGPEVQPRDVERRRGRGRSASGRAAWCRSAPSSCT